MPQVNSSLHGRNAGYPAPPVQTPACSFSAPGSSVLLASAQDLAIKQTLVGFRLDRYFPQEGWLVFSRPNSVRHELPMQVS